MAFLYLMETGESSSTDTGESSSTETGESVSTETGESFSRSSLENYAVAAVVAVAAEDYHSMIPAPLAAVEDHHSMIDIDLLQSQHGIPLSDGRRRISDNPPQSSFPARRHPLSTAPTTTDSPGQFSAPARRPSKMSKRSFHGFLAFVIIFLFVLWWFFPSEKLEVKDGRMMNVNKAELPFSLNTTHLDLERLAMLAVAHPSNTSV